MPAVPIPPIANISGASWNDGFNPSGIGAAAGAVGAPVNPTMSGLAQASQQAQQALQGAQAKSALTDVQQKQRGMQASMLGALANLPPDQFEANKASVIGTINKLNPSWQFDPNLDQGTAKMAAMSGLPMQEQPEYSMNMAKAQIMNAAMNKELGGTQSTGNPPANNYGMPSPGLALAFPEGARAQADVASKGIPYQTDLDTSKNTAVKQVENTQNAKVATENYGKLHTSIDAMQKILDSGDLPDSSVIPASWKNAFNNRLPVVGQDGVTPDNLKSALAYAQFRNLNEQMNISGVQQLAAAGGRPSQTIDKMIQRGYAVDQDAPNEVKASELNNLDAELFNQGVAARNIAGHKEKYREIPVNTGTKTAATQAQGAFGNDRGGQPSQSTNYGPGAIVKGSKGTGFIYMGGDKTDPKNYKPVGSSGQ